jgi:hypothetical protein
MFTEVSAWLSVVVLAILSVRMTHLSLVFDRIISGRQAVPEESTNIYARDKAGIKVGQAYSNTQKMWLVFLIFSVVLGIIDWPTSRLPLAATGIVFAAILTTGMVLGWLADRELQGQRRKHGYKK